MADKMRFLVVGCGNIAQRCSIPALMQSGVSEIVCCVDSNSAKGAEIQAKFGLPFETDIDIALDRYLFDAVYIAVPNAVHLEIIRKAASHHKQILCEKPLAGSLEDAEEIARIGKEYGVAIFEGFMYQFHDQYSIRTRMIEDGAIGRPFLFQAWFGFPPIPSTDFRYSRELGGGCVLDSCAYLVHSARHFFGTEPVKVYSILEKEGHDVEVRASIMMDFGDSRSAMLVSGFDNKYKNEITVWGTEGIMRVERAFAQPADYHSKITVEKQDGTVEYTMPACNHFIKEIEYFVTNCDASAESWREEFLHQSKVLSDIKSSLESK